MQSENESNNQKKETHGSDSKKVKYFYDADWSSLDKVKMKMEWIKIAVSVLLPVTILVATCKLQKSEDNRANDDRIANLRFETFEQLSEHLNNIYCYFTYVGQWKELTPIDIIYEKRSADKIENMYSFLFSEEFKTKYKNFISACFLESKIWGKDALLRTDYKNRDTIKPTTRLRDTVYNTFNWNKSWDSLFVTFYPDKFKNLEVTGYSHPGTPNDYTDVIAKKYKELTDLIGSELNTISTRKTAFK